MFSKKLHDQYQVVAYDPSEPPKDGPIVWEVFEAEGSKTPSAGKKLGEFRTTREEAKEEMSKDAQLTKQLRKSKLVSPTAEVWIQDGDEGNLLVYVTGSKEEDTYSLFVSVKKEYKKMLSDY